MAALPKYRMVFKDDFGQNVQVDILSSDAILVPITIVGSTNPVTISFNGDDNDVYQPMITSKAIIRILLPEDDVTLYEDLVSMKEDTFGVSIKITGGVLDYEWHGWLVPDEQVRSFSYTGQTVEITAIDPIGKLKGQPLIGDDNIYITGENNLKHYVTSCFDPIFNPNNTVGGYTMEVNSPLRLSYDTIDVLPDILEQLSVSAEMFNDEEGRPINGYQVIEKIARSLTMRCYYDNRVLFFTDFNYLESIAIINKIPLNIKNSNNTNNILIKPEENITAQRTFREAKATFEYAGVTGLLTDGYLNAWEAFGGGYRLITWEYNSDLLAQPDVYNRRRGNGRKENPYGIEIRMYYDYLDPSDPNQPKSYEIIGSGAAADIVTADELKLAIRMRAVNAAYDDPLYNAITYFKAYATIVVYNSSDPARSFASLNTNDAMTWEQVDLTGSSFATGSIDWSAYYTFSGNNYPIGVLAATTDIQTVNLEMPPIPDDVEGKAFAIIRSIKPTHNGALMAPQLYSETIIYDAILSKANGKVGGTIKKGEIVYISRDISTSLDKIERSIDMNTTSTLGVAGEIKTQLTYTTTGGYVVGPGNVPILTIHAGIDGFVTLLQYSARVMMGFNYPQYKIDLNCRASNLLFHNTIGLAGLYDAARPSTSIFQSPYMIMSSTYSIKDGQRKLIIISMKKDERLLSGDTIDPTHDLVENYYIS